jgi:hypothetical protein
MGTPQGDANFWSEKKHKGFSRASAAEDHQDFEGACEAYGRYFRSVFMHTFVKTFLRSAKKDELRFLRKAIAAAARAEKNAKRGRPSAACDDRVLRQARFIAMRRYVHRETWKEIANGLGLDPARLKTHIRTMKRQLKFLAEVVWEGLDLREDYAAELADMILEWRGAQISLRTKTGLPFDVHPEKCVMIMLNLKRWLNGTPERSGHVPIISPQGR